MKKILNIRMTYFIHYISFVIAIDRMINTFLIGYDENLH